MSSDSESSTTSRGSSPELSAPKKFAKAAANGDFRNEGVEAPTWAYQPPLGCVEIQNLGDAGEFDWDAVNNNDDVEVWLIRCPDAIKPKHLAGLKIDAPSTSSSTKRSRKVGSLKRKTHAFDVWTVAPPSDQKSAQADEDEVLPIGGEEITTLSCLLPRSKKGKLFAAPKPIAQRLVFAAQPVVASAPAEGTLPQQDPATKKYTNPARPSYPEDVLVHSFKPIGSYSSSSPSTSSPSSTKKSDESIAMDVDQTASPKKAKKGDEKKEKKSKKRKVAPSDEAPEAEEIVPKKKSKKVKSS